MATVHRPKPENDGKGKDAKLIVHVKGAPDRMITLYNKQFKARILNETEDINRDYWIEQIAILSSHGLRCLALLRGELDKCAAKQGDQLDPEFVNDKGEWLTIVGIRRFLLARGADVWDSEFGFFDEEQMPNQDSSLPKGASHLNLTTLHNKYKVI